MAGFLPIREGGSGHTNSLGQFPLRHVLLLTEMVQLCPVGITANAECPAHARRMLESKKERCCFLAMDC